MRTINEIVNHKLFNLLVLGVLLFPLFLHHITWPELIITKLDHCPLFMCDFQRHYLPQAQALLAEEQVIVSGWFYPPLLAIFLMPIAWLGAEMWIWGGANLGAWCTLVWLTHSESKLSWSWCIVLSLLNLSVLHSLKWGQVSLIINVLMLLGLRYHPTWIALAGALKIYPLALLVIVRTTLRQWMYTFLALCVFTLILPIMVVGLEATVMLWENIPVGARRVQGFAASAGGQAFDPTAWRYLLDGSHVGLPMKTQGLLFNGSMLIFWVIKILFYCVMGLHTFRAVCAARDTLSKGLVVLLGLWLVLSPGWHHYYSLIPFILCWSWSRGGSKIILCGVVILQWLPIFLLGLLPQTYVVFSAWGGGFWSILLLWGCVTQQCIKINRNSNVYKGDK